MYCQKCNAYLNDNSRVCPQCGAPIDGEEKKITTTTTYEGPLGNPTPVLVWGIVGLGFSVTFYLSFLGIIFSLIGLHKARQYNEFTGYAPSNMARIGRRLSIAGVIVGIILTIALIAFIIFAAGSYNRYYFR